MRILLVIPTSYYSTCYPSFLSLSDFPVGFAYIASALKSAGHNVFGLNPNNDASYTTAFEMLASKLNDSIGRSSPELIGIGGLSTDFHFLKDCIRLIRKINPKIPIVMGGGIISNDAEYIFCSLKPDFCIIGEGEEAIVQLVGILAERGECFGNVCNIGYWENGSPIFTEKHIDYPDLDIKHFPDYEPFDDFEMINNYSFATRSYYRYTRLDPRPMTIVTARGCPFACTFCLHKKNRGYRARSIDNIMQEIALLYKKYQFNVLVILDELFAANKERVNEFVNGVIDGRNTYGWDFDWMFQTHASASLDEKTLVAAKRAGCYLFSYGLESASPTVLESMNKKTNNSQIIEAIRITDKVGIGFGGNFIFGDIAENIDTICETMDFFSAHCRDIHIYLTYIQPYPGSELFDRCLEKGIIKNKDDYYELGDTKSYNMTSLPDYIWFSWKIGLMRFASRLGWVRTVKATAIAKESLDNDTATYFSQNMYRIRAKCPYCGYESDYREPLIGSARKRAESFVIEKIKLLRHIWSEGLLWYCILSVLLPLINPAFRRLGYLKSSDDNANTVISGCQACHKRIKIEIPDVTSHSILKKTDE